MSYEVIAEYADELRSKPHLLPWVEPDDVTLDEAQRRYDECISRALRRLNAAGVEVRAIQYTESGRETTMLSPPPPETS